MVMLIEDGDVEEEEDPSQDRDPHFVRACTVEIHLDISEQQFYARICRKNAAPQKLGVRFVRACAAEMHMDMSQEPCHAEI